MLGFNPCFLGTRPRTALMGKTLDSPCRVSILVFLELALGLDFIMDSLSTNAMFQSLFSWNSPSDYWMRACWRS